MFKPKAENFKKQIRRQYLNEYFKKKRKQFNLIPHSQQQQQMSTITKISQKINKVIVDNNKIIPQKGIPDLEQLKLIATFSQIQIGVQCLIKTQIPAGTLSYLSPLYYNTKQQHLATCIFANITYIKPDVCPSHQFMRSITNIIDNTDLYGCMQSGLKQQQSLSKDMLRDTVDNCLLIIYHLMVDFPDATEFYINECNMAKLMYGMCDSGVDNYTGDKILKIMVLVTAHHKGKKEKHLVRKFLKNYLSVFENTNQESFLYLSLANIRELLAVYVDAIQVENGGNQLQQYGATKNSEAEKDLHEIISQIAKSRLLEKLTHLYPYMASRQHITRCAFFVIKIMLPKMQRETVEKRLLPLLSKMIDAIYSEDSTSKDYLGQATIFTQKHSQTNQERLSSAVYVRTEFYQIIYAFLQIWPSDHDMLIKHPLFDKISSKYLEFEETSSNDGLFVYETREYFIYIFGMLGFSGKLNMGLKNMLRVSIERYRTSMKIQGGEKSKQDQSGSLDWFVQNVEQQLGGQIDYEI